MSQAKVVTAVTRIETRRLILRKLSLKDTDFIYSHFKDENLCRHFDSRPFTDRQQARDFIQRCINPDIPEMIRWGIVNKDDSTLIGTCGFEALEQRDARARICYDLNWAYWGQGIMLEALKEVIRNGFEKLCLNRIEAWVNPENTRCTNLLRKLGFRKEGILREQNRDAKGNYLDQISFSLLKRDWSG